MGDIGGGDELLRGGIIPLSALCIHPKTNTPPSIATEPSDTDGFT